MRGGDARATLAHGFTQKRAGAAGGGLLRLGAPSPDSGPPPLSNKDRCKPRDRLALTSSPSRTGRIDLEMVAGGEWLRTYRDFFDKSRPSKPRPPLSSIARFSDVLGTVYAR